MFSESSISNLKVVAQGQTQQEVTKLSNSGETID